jgi:uncharacterized protein YbaR (Trm112 family)
MPPHTHLDTIHCPFCAGFLAVARASSGVLYTHLAPACDTYFRTDPFELAAILQARLQD